MGQNLTGQLISNTYEDLVQISGSVLTDGLGNDITSLTVTASNATSAVSASHAVNADIAISASFATTAASATTATSASHALNANNAISSSYALTASFAENVTPIDTGSFMITGSVSSNTLTFTKGDGSTFNLTVDTGSAATVDTGSLLVTASISDATITFTKGDASTFDITVNNVLNASTASLATNATNAVSASHALFADNAGAASTAISSSHAVNADFAITASFALNAGGTVNTGSFYISSSVNDATITFNQGDGTTESVTVNNVLNASTASAVDTTPANDNVEYALTFVAQEAAGTQVVRTDDNSNITFNPSTGVLSVPTVDGTATNALTASFLPASTNLNITSISASGGNFINLSAVSASFGHVTTVTGSAVIIGDEFIILNANTPAARYAGLVVYDSGSGSPATASFEWDGLTDNWIIQEETGNTAVVLTGPTGSRGVEVLPTINVLQKGGGHHQLIDSSITDDGTTVSIDANAEVTGSLTATSGFTGSLEGTASFAVTASFALNAGGGELSGLISGSGVGSLISANYQPTASVASGDNSIAIGNGSTADGTNQIVLGSNISSSAPNNTNTVVVGSDNLIQGDISDSVIIGRNFNAQNFNTQMVSIGSNSSTKFINDQGVTIGYNAGGALASVTIGHSAAANGNYAVAMGGNSAANGEDSIAIGRSSFAVSQNSIAIGQNQTTADIDEINIGGAFRYNSGSSGAVELVSSTGSVIYRTGGLSGSLIDNVTDVYTTTATAEHIVTLTQAEYNTISSSADPNTLYYITDAPSFATSASFAESASFATTATSASYTVSASFAENALSSSYALTASFLEGGIPIPTLQEVTVAGNTTDQGMQFTDGTTANTIIANTGVAITINSIDNSTPMEYSFTDNNGLDTSGVRFDPATFALDVFTYNDAPITLGSFAIAESRLEVTGSLRGAVTALSISSNTASMDLSANNFFTLTLVSGSNTFVNPTNILPGQTVNLRVTQPSPGFGTISFPSSVNQVSGSVYVPTAVASAQDIVTFISFDSTDLYLSNVKNLV